MTLEEIKVKINHRVEKVTGSIIRRILERCNELEGSINLSIGEPDLPTPRVIIEKSSEYMLNNQLGYPKAGGIDILRDEIANHYNTRYKGNYTKDNVLVTIGATEGLSTALRTILSKGDEVIIIKPEYPLYSSLAKLLEVDIKYIDTSDTGYTLNYDDLVKSITPRTKAIILNYPSNPCGTSLTRDEVKKISKLVIDQGVFLIADEVYSEIIFSLDSFTSFGEFAKGRDNFIIVNGFSKSYSMTGWRLGYTLSSTRLRGELLKVNQYTTSTVPTLSQIGGVIALQEVKSLRSNIDIYRKRANYLYSRLKGIGLSPTKSIGTLYMMVDYTMFTSKDSLSFALDLLEATGVAIVPSIAFGVEGAFRVSYTKEIEELEEACQRIERYLSSTK